MKALNIAAFALNAALYVAVGVLFSVVVPLKFGGVRFWPQVIIPATFAALFGPWVGGFGAAVGIFLSDIMLGNDPILSLMAGVTSNFICFWLVGYIANKKTRWLIPVVSYGIATAALAWIAYIYTDLLAVGIIVAIYAIFVAVILSSSKWRSYEVGSIIGLLVGSAIIGGTVPLFFALFTPPGTEPLVQFTLASGIAVFLWTFVTEIPFMLVLGPPIIAAVKRAFPKLNRKEESSELP
ncbi:MAG TPA: ECF transporter S component [Candidatus Bathyarchaeia archaeon]